MRNLTFFIALLLFGCQSTTEKTSKEKPKFDYYAQGKVITSLAQAELQKNLKKAMKEGGPVHAIEFCNINATHLTDSVSNIFDVEVQRISLKNRNLNNAAIGPKEKILLNNFLESSLESTGLRDTLIAFEGKLLYYRPIMIGMEACLKCHGQKGKNIDNETIIALNKLYPKDKATNYRMGEFRGVWKVTFSNLENN